MQVLSIGHALPQNKIFSTGIDQQQECPLGHTERQTGMHSQYNVTKESEKIRSVEKARPTPITYLMMNNKKRYLHSRKTLTITLFESVRSTYSFPLPSVLCRFSS